MKQIFNRRSLAAMPFLLGLVFFAGLMSVNAVTLFGVNTNNQLVRFESDTPGTLTTVGAITGLQTGENILGIDFRPATGQLFGLGSTSRLYVINRMTGAATAVGGQFTPVLSGTNFGFDFNPTVDRIRIISNTGQNLRVNPSNGVVIVDTPLNPGTPGVTGAAYSNSFGVSATTTLYDIDSTTDMLLIQNPANSGTLTAVGPLGVDFQDANGFDIVSNNAGGTSTTTNTAYAVATSGVLNNPTLYTINLTTGAATSLGAIGGITNTTALRGLAVAASGASAASNLLDFNGDRRADYSVFRPSNGTVYATRPDGMLAFALPFGNAGDDTFTPGDYDGDGRTDVAVFRNSTGVFYVFRSSDNTVVTTQFGLPGDEPVARDYDGDGRTDYAVVRRSPGALTWYIQNSATNTFTTTQFGFDTDVVAPGDYDGDGKFDLAVFRGTGNQPATFYVQRSSGGFSQIQFGLASDLVVPGDYDGDGKTDYAVVRGGSNFTWYVLRSSNNSFFAVQFGQKPDLPVQNDYDGDGKTDIAVFRQQNGTFYVFRSTDGVPVTTTFGMNGDYPLANYDTH